MSEPDWTPSDQWLRRNLTAVATTAMVHNRDAGTELVKRKLIRRQTRQWYDLTPDGEELLSKLTAEQENDPS